MSLICAVQCDQCGRVAQADFHSPLRLAWRKSLAALRIQLTMLGWEVGPASVVNAADRCPACVEKYGPVVPESAGPEMHGDTPATIQRAIDLEMNREESRREPPY